MKNYSLKYKFLGLIIFLFLFSFIAFFYIFYDFQKQKLKILKDEQILKIDNSFNKNIEKHLKNYYFDIAKKIFDSEDDYEIKLTIKENDRKKLEEIIAEKYDILVKKDKYITQMNFFSKDKINIFRLQKLDLSGEKLRDNRPLLNDAFNTKKVVSGFENGLTGLSYRVIIPLFDNQNDFIGVFEIGISPKKLLDTVTFFNNIEGVFYNNYSKDFLTSKAIDSKFLEYLEKFKYENKNQDIEFDNKHLNLQFFNIFSNDGKNLGNFIFFHDLTKYYDDFYNVVKNLILISLFTIFIIYLIVVYTFNIFYKQISIQKNRAEKILDSSNSIIIVSNNGKNLTQANQAFLEFFNLKSISEFTNKYSCICDHFIEEKNYLSSQIGELSWVEYISKNPNKTHFVKMKKDNKFHTFKVFIKNINDPIFNLNEIVVTFEDITQELENEELLKQSSKYNQALFDNTPVAIFLASSNRVILNLNNTACEIFGYTKEELLNQSFERIHLSKESFDKFSLEYKKFENSILTNFEFPLKHKNGNTIFCSLFGTPLDNSDLSKGFIWTLLDITEKKLAEKALIKERNLFSNGPVVVVEWKFDKNWTVKYISSNCETVLGYTKEEMLSQDFNYSSIIHEDDSQRVSKEVSFYIKDRNSYEQSYRIRLKNGEYRWFYDFNQVIKNSSGEVKAIRGYMFDQTQLKESEIILQKMNEELKLQTDIAQKANESKNQFLANMSHEMRTPMNAIIGLSELLADTKIDEKQYDFIKKINTSSKLLLGIISDILNFSKIEAGNFDLDLDLKAFSLENLLSQLRAIFYQVENYKNIELYFYNKSGNPKIVLSDELRILQVLTNFISNALKFTNKGNITLKIELLEKTSANSAKIRFSVQDTGIGISEDEIPNLFKPFFQVDNSATRKYGGTGLGLSISERIVNSLGSTIEVQSQKDVGTEFSFTINMEVLEWSKENLLNSKKFKILIVDDQEISRVILKDILENFDYVTYEAKDGIESIEMVKEADISNEPFDFILMDFNMPRLNGKEAIKKIYELYNQKEIKKTIPSILMVSAYSKDEINLDDVHIDNFLTKPVTSSTLFDALAQIKKGIVKEINSSDIHKGAPNLFGLKILLVEDNEINQEVASMFLQKAQIEVDVANNGLEAVEIYKKNQGKYDLILMDLQMPILSGYDATIQIREFDKNIPIVALTAAAMIEDKEKVLKFGMNDHLSKPINSNELYNTIIKYSKKITKKDLISSKSQSDENIVLDWEFLEKSLNNKELINKLLNKFIEQLNTDFASIVKKVRENSSDAPSLIHGLKGVSGNLGANSLFEICKKIDSKFKNKNAVNSVEISTLEEEIAKVKFELKHLDSTKNQLNKENINILSKIEFKELINSIKKDLKDGSVILEETLEKLYLNLKNRLSNQDIKTLKDFIDDFEYSKALDILEKLDV
ncbi:response regulator [Aliarcobacter butzleri]|uniref:response regulator n=1 Tax=Aliarcobacter butzleri TaxID=28197 RepID=UPI00263F5A4F|nr:response regulator [Aliarcobacter butzleri]MDN5103026.1 response regulator [Aliarcobacter butzleri]